MNITFTRFEYLQNRKRTGRVISGKVSEEVDEHAAGWGALSLGNSASSASPFAGGVQALFVVL